MVLPALQPSGVHGGGGTGDGWVEEGCNGKGAKSDRVKEKDSLSYYVSQNNTIYESSFLFTKFPKNYMDKPLWFMFDLSNISIV